MNVFKYKNTLKMLQNIILLLLTAIAYSSGNDIQPQTTIIRAFLSKPLTINCSFSKAKVSWMSSTNQYLYSYLDCRSDYPHTITNTLYQGVTSNCSQVKKTTFLTLPFITKKHNNMLINCSKRDEQNSIFRIKIIHAPAVQVNNVKVKIGQPATLNCKFRDLEHYEMLSLKWTQEIYGEQIEGHVSNRSQLIFNNVSWSDTGNWTCTVMVKHYQKPLVGSGTLSVTGVLVLDHLKSVIEVEVSQRKMVEIVIYSYLEKITVEWYHNSIIIIDRISLFRLTRRATVANHTIHLPVHVTKLSFDDIKQKDSGNYTLSVHNNEGVSTITFTLRVTEKPIDVVLIIGISSAITVFILLIILLVCFWYFSIRKKSDTNGGYTRCIIPPDISPDISQPTSSSFENSWNEKVLSNNTKSLNVSYSKKLNNDTCYSEKDDEEHIYQEIGYIDMTTAKHLKSTQNIKATQNLKSTENLKSTQNLQSTLNRKSTQNEYLNPRSICYEHK